MPSALFRMVCVVLLVIAICGGLTTPVLAATRFHDARRLSPEVLLSTTNALRCVHGVPPLAWDPELARQAQGWADHQATNNNCAMTHSNGQFFASNFGDTKGRGENLIWGSERYYYDDAENVVFGWYNEGYTYNLTSTSISAAGAPGRSLEGYAQNKINHFTTMIWKNLNRMGCGLVTCLNSANTWYTGELWVCQYRGGADTTVTVPNIMGAASLAANVPPPVKSHRECGVRWQNVASFNDHCKSLTNDAGHPWAGVDTTQPAGCSSFYCVKADGTKSSQFTKAPDEIPCTASGRSGVCHKGWCDTTRAAQPASTFNICSPNPCRNGGTCNPSASLKAPQRFPQTPLNPDLCRCAPGFTGDLCDYPMPAPTLPAPAGCDHSVSGICYKTFPTLGLVNYATAKQTCQQWGGFLPSLTETWQSEFLFDIAPYAHLATFGGTSWSAPHFHLWLGASRTNGAWSWDDGSGALVKPSDTMPKLDTYLWPVLAGPLFSGSATNNVAVNMGRSWLAWRREHKLVVNRATSYVVCSKRSS